MTLDDLKRAYEPVPASLEAHVQNTLARLDVQNQGRRIPLRTAAIIAALVLALCGAAYALLQSQVASFYGWLYGGTWEAEMLAGDMDTASRTYQLGNVMYTLEEMVYKKDGDYQGLYAAVRITPAQGRSVVLMPTDYDVNDVAGYLSHYGTAEKVPENAPSYAELARLKGCNITMARLSVDEVFLNGERYEISIMGESWVAQPDGSILGGLEIADKSFTASDQYELNLRVSNWEITPEGDWLREEPHNTWLFENWTVAFAPTVKGE